MKLDCQIYDCGGVVFGDHKTKCSKCGFSKEDIEKFGSNIPGLILGRKKPDKQEPSWSQIEF